MFKRIFDIVLSLIGLVCLMPILLIITLIIIINDGLPVFYLQQRVGKNNQHFLLFKFRTMYKDADKKGLLTVGGRDPRVTPIGYYLRKYKIDELPQLLNVLTGTMSLVGPRPEVRKYVDLYTAEQMKVLHVKPGITDLASIYFINENELLADAENPEETYIYSIMPQKLKLNLEYISTQSMVNDFKIILKTIFKIIQ